MPLSHCRWSFGPFGTGKKTANVQESMPLAPEKLLCLPLLSPLSTPGRNYGDVSVQPERSLSEREGGVEGRRQPLQHGPSTPLRYACPEPVEALGANGPTRNNRRRTSGYQYLGVERET